MASDWCEGLVFGFLLSVGYLACGTYIDVQCMAAGAVQASRQGVYAGPVVSGIGSCSHLPPA